MARHLVENGREHDDSLLVLFVDLKKANDSVPRSALLVYVIEVWYYSSHAECHRILLRWHEGRDQETLPQIASR